MDADERFDPREMFQHLPFPFEDGHFSARLGAVVQVTVLDGKEPVLLVAHPADNSWLVGDGLNDTNLPGAAVATHMSHVLAQDPSVAELAGLPLGQQAARPTPGEPWVVTNFEWLDAADQ